MFQNLLARRPVGCRFPDFEIFGGQRKRDDSKMDKNLEKIWGADATKDIDSLGIRQVIGCLETLTHDWWDGTRIGWSWFSCAPFSATHLRHYSSSLHAATQPFAHMR